MLRINTAQKGAFMKKQGFVKFMVSAAFCCVAVTACSEKKSEVAAPEAAPVQAAAPEAAAGAAAAPAGASEARTIFEQRCQLCHGANGTGDGAAAANLNPKPRNYTDAAWQASVTDEYLAKIIVEGGQAVGKSMMMPPNPDLKDKPQVVTDLVGIVRSFGRK